MTVSMYDVSIANMYSNMRDSIFRIQVTTDMAKSCAARLTGKADFLGG